MSRLFVTQREIDFISDITKELMKDVNAQAIYYYSISELKTKTHPVYDEAEKKIFDNPIKIDAFVDNIFEQDTKIDASGIDKDYKVEVFLQYRDLVERGIEVSLGDYFTYSSITYEITEKKRTRNIFGLAEYADGVRIVGAKARKDTIQLVLNGPTDIKYNDADAVKDTFVQQRGVAETSEGETGDERALVKKGVIDAPLTGPKQVAKVADEHDRNAFYGEE